MRGSPWWAVPQIPHRQSSQSLLTAPVDESRNVRNRLAAQLPLASPSDALLPSTSILPIWGWSPLSKSTLWDQLPGVWSWHSQASLDSYCFGINSEPLREHWKGGSHRECLGWSTGLTSIGRNSTLHPISEFGGGGLNLIVCQFVDWIFYNSKKEGWDQLSTHLKHV